MTKLQSTIVFVLSLIGLMGSVAWFATAPDYEPAIGIALGLSGIIATHWPWKARLTPSERIAAHDKWRPIFEEYFARQARDGHTGGDVIIHDMARLKGYLSNKQSRGISSWFRVGLMGTYNEGILLGLNWEYIEQHKNGKWRVNRKSSDGVKVVLLGQVPYDAIESVNWDGDKTYNKPHIYLHFDYGGEPYERLFYGEQKRLQEKFPFFYTSIAEFSEAQPRFAKLKGWVKRVFPLP